MADEHISSWTIADFYQFSSGTFYLIRSLKYLFKCVVERGGIVFVFSYHLCYSIEVQKRMGK